MKVCPYCKSELSIASASGKLLCDDCGEEFHSSEEVILHWAGVERDALYKISSKIHKELLDTGHIERRTIMELRETLEDINK